jgi:hypothetical protein
MPDENNQPTASHILRALHEFVQEEEEDVATKPLSEVKAELAKRGITTSTLTARMKEEVAKARAHQELAAARTVRERSIANLKTFQAKLTSLPEKAREQATAVLSALSTKDPAMAAAYFSKFEEASDADLQSLLDDLSLLEEPKDGKNSRRPS